MLLLFPAVKFHFVRISPVSFALHQAEASVCCSAATACRVSYTAFPAGQQQALGRKLEMQEGKDVSSGIRHGARWAMGWQKLHCLAALLMSFF